MPNLTDAEREHRRREFSGRWMPSKQFTVKRQGVCTATACGQVIREGEPAFFRRWEGTGNVGHLVHVECLEK